VQLHGHSKQNNISFCEIGLRQNNKMHQQDHETAYSGVALFRCSNESLSLLLALRAC
jgi:hypothetical protein